MLRCKWFAIRWRASLNSKCNPNLNKDVFFSTRSVISISILLPSTCDLCKCNGFGSIKVLWNVIQNSKWSFDKPDLMLWILQHFWLSIGFWPMWQLLVDLWNLFRHLILVMFLFFQGLQLISMLNDLSNQHLSMTILPNAHSRAVHRTIVQISLQRYSVGAQKIMNEIEIVSTWQLHRINGNLHLP